MWKENADEVAMLNRERGQLVWHCHNLVSCHRPTCEKNASDVGMLAMRTTLAWMPRVLLFKGRKVQSNVGRRIRLS